MEPKKNYVIGPDGLEEVTVGDTGNINFKPKDGKKRYVNVDNLVKCEVGYFSKFFINSTISALRQNRNHSILNFLEQPLPKEFDELVDDNNLLLRAIDGNIDIYPKNLPDDYVCFARNYMQEKVCELLREYYEAYPDGIPQEKINELKILWRMRNIFNSAMNGDE